MGKYYEPLTYQHLNITTREIERTALFNLPHEYHVTCTRTDGWQLWHNHLIMAGEYNETNGLRLDVEGFVICDSLTGKENK